MVLCGPTRVDQQAQFTHGENCSIVFQTNNAKWIPNLPTSIVSNNASKRRGFYQNLMGFLQISSNLREQVRESERLAPCITEVPRFTVRHATLFLTSLSFLMSRFWERFRRYDKLRSWRERNWVLEEEGGKRWGVIVGLLLFFFRSPFLVHLRDPNPSCLLSSSSIYVPHFSP